MGRAPLRFNFQWYFKRNENIDISKGKGKKLTAFLKIQFSLSFLTCWLHSGWRWALSRTHSAISGRPSFSPSPAPLQGVWSKFSWASSGLQSEASFERRRKEKWGFAGNPSSNIPTELLESGVALLQPFWHFWGRWGLKELSFLKVQTI